MESEAPAESDLSDSQQGQLGELPQSAVSEWDDDSEGCVEVLKHLSS